VAEEFRHGPRGVQIAIALALVASVAVSLLAAPGAEGVFGALLATLMLAIAATDARRYRIPNELTAAAFGLALLRAFTTGPEAGADALLWACARAVAVALPLLGLMLLYRRWRGRDGLGLGDVKLAAACGAWLDLPTVVAVIELAALSAIAAYFVNAALRKAPLRATALLPFGLFLAPAIWLGWLGESLLAAPWFGSWFGAWLEPWLEFWLAS
jgi:leader peptidase (prepilin peptidase) / N-methyltransferase